MDIFKLVGSVFVDTEEANKSLSKTDEAAQSTGSTLGKIATTAGKVGAAIGGAAIAAGTAAVKMASDTASTLDVVDKASQRMNISAESYQELAHAASLSGVEMSTMEMAARKLEGTDLSLDDALEQIYAFETAEERSAAAAELFGDRVAYQMSPMLNASAEDMAAMRQEANDLGLVLSQDTVTAGAVLNDTLSNLKDSFTAIGTKLGAELMPFVQSFAELILEFLPTVQTLFDALAPVLISVMEALMPAITELVTNLMPVIVELINVLAPVFTQLVQLVMPIFVQLIGMIAPILTPLIQLLTPILQLTMAILEPLLQLIDLILPPLIKIIEYIVDKVVTRVQKQIEVVLKVVNALKEGIRTSFEQIVEFVKKPVNVVINIINGLISGVVGGINGIIRALNRLQINVPAWVTKLTGVSSFGFNLAEVSAPQIPLLAQGGELGGGAAIVGEDGPELIQTNGSRTRVTPLNDNNNAFTELNAKLDELIGLLRNGFGVRLDSGAMVGQLAPAIDKKLGLQTVKAGRRV